MASKSVGGVKNRNNEDSLGNPALELDDPTPDIFALFTQYNEQFFEGRLGAVTVEWSKRMTTCAGLCYYHGKSGGCRIKLSEPLLSYRPRSDLIDTLLHEMIHAYIFIVFGGSLDRDGHGKDFQDIMHRINSLVGTKITVYHSFHDEVAHHKKHWWRCDGPCRTRGPFHGFVKRAMNRAPGPNDYWWTSHKANCNGNFIKIKEPEPVQKPKSENSKRKLKDHSVSVSKGNDISKFFKKMKMEDEGKDKSGANEASLAGTSYAKVLPKLNDTIVLESDDEDELKKAIALSLGLPTETTSAVSGTLKTSATTAVKTAATKNPSINNTPKIPPRTTVSNLIAPPIEQQHRGIFQPKSTSIPKTDCEKDDDNRFPGKGYRLGG